MLTDADYLAAAQWESKAAAPTGKADGKFSDEALGKNGDSQFPSDFPSAVS